VKELIGMGRRVILKKDVEKSAIASVNQKADNYVSRVAKYIPAEVVAVYLFIEGVLKNATTAGWLHWGVFFLLLVLTPIYIWRVTKQDALPPSLAHIIISFFSFAIWVFATGGPFVGLSWYDPLYGSVLVAIYTLIIPIIVA
jgi:hypothetical protein